MKQNLISVFLLLFLTTSGFCQKTNCTKEKCVQVNKSSVVKVENDTVPTIELRTKQKDGLMPLYYINGMQYHTSVLRTLDPKFIDSIHVVKEIRDNNHYGEIYITMKPEYRPKLISLADLKQKYGTEVKKSTIFMIDNDIIKENYSDYLVDEKYILKIIFDTIENENLTVQVIRLITRTEENINKSKEITLRGNK